MGLSFWLFISIIVVTIFAIISLILINIKVKKIKKEAEENTGSLSPDS